VSRVSVAKTCPQHGIGRVSRWTYLPTLKPRTQERYRTSFRQLNVVFGTLYLDEITRGRLADYASDRMRLAPRARRYAVIWRP
jgi:hypothetical protein